MNLEYILARRTAVEDRSSRSSVMMRIALLAVVIGLAVMIITLSVIGGFRGEIYSSLRGFGADVVLTHYSATSLGDAEPLAYDSTFVESLRRVNGVESVAEYAIVGAMAKSGDNVTGLQLKGIASSYPKEWWQSRLVEGALPDVESPTRHKEILLSQATVERLSLSVGDKVEMLFMEDERPRRDRFKLCGIYSTGLEEMDLMFAVVDIRDLRRVASWDEDMITGYDLLLSDSSGTERVKQEVEQICYGSDNFELANIVARDLMEREPVIFDWLKAHNINAEVIIVILLCVLIFNMASAMLIMVLDRRATIGLLKAQGMRNSAIRRMFLIRAMMLFLRGAFWGNLIGIGLVVAQDIWHIVELDASGYMLNFLPVSIEWWWLVALNVGVLIITLLMLLLPSYLVARISPSESLRYR